VALGVWGDIWGPVWGPIWQAAQAPEPEPAPAPAAALIGGTIAARGGRRRRGFADLLSRRSPGGVIVRVDDDDTRREREEREASRKRDRERAKAADKADDDARLARLAAEQEKRRLAKLRHLKVRIDPAEPLAIGHGSVDAVHIVRVVAVAPASNLEVSLSAVVVQKFTAVETTLLARVSALESQLANDEEAKRNDEKARRNREALMILLAH
jgi:hypothetical protein